MRAELRRLFRLRKFVSFLVILNGRAFDALLPGFEMLRIGWLADLVPDDWLPRTSRSQDRRCLTTFSREMSSRSMSVIGSLSCKDLRKSISRSTRPTHSRMLVKHRR